jgi:DNA-binding transcriptional ArsR family regulator
MKPTEHISRFTPSNMSPETLEAIFVQRHDLAVDTVERIRDSVLTGNIHNQLFVGPRGCGKTHYMSLIAHRVFAIEDLRDKLRVAWLNEDETTTTFLDLLIRIHKALAARYPNEFPPASLDQLFGLPASIAQQRLQSSLLEQLAGKKCLVIIENLDATFQGLGLSGQHALRAFLLQHPEFPLLATAQRLDKHLTSRDAPFFGFFQTQNLQPLSFDDAVHLLERIAQLHGNKDLEHYLRQPQGRARVRAIHHLAGGNHRVYVILSEFIDRNSLDQLIKPFEQMLDELTPYYQERLHWISPQQRRIVELLSAFGSPVPVKVISDRLFATPQTISGQLKSLKETGYVRSHDRGRESWYELSEPLMRLSIEIKENRGAPIRLLVDFLRSWYRQSDLREISDTLPPGSSRERLHVEEAIRRIEKDELSGEHSPLVSCIVGEIARAQSMGETEALLNAREELASIREEIMDWFMFAWASKNAGDTDRARRGYIASKSLKPASAQDHYAIALMHGTFSEFANALAAIDRACEMDSRSLPYNGYRSLILLTLERWDESLQQMRHVLRIMNETDTEDAVLGEDVRAMVLFATYSHISDESALERVRGLVAIFSEQGMLSVLGASLVQSLRDHSENAAWQKDFSLRGSIWTKASRGYATLELPIAVYSAAIELITTSDPAVLLRLPVEQRALLEETIKINK